MGLNIGILESSRSAAPSTSYLLDSYPGAAAAYSLRKLRSAYTGSTIRVRRDSDNTEQDIGFDGSGNLDTITLQNFVGSENYIYYSQDFSNATNWIKSNNTVSINAAIAPDGTTTANNCILANNTSAKYIYQTIPSVSTRDYVYSIYAKANQYNYAQLMAVRDSSNRYSIVVDLTNGTITQSNSVGTPNFVSSLVTPVGNGWYRLSITLNINLGTNYYVFCPSPVSNPTLDSSLSLTSSGNGTSGVYFWGAQLNYNALKPYQITTSTQKIFCSGYVTKWYDQSGNVRDVQQGTATNQSQIVNVGILNTQNGKPCLTFNGTSSGYLEIQSFFNFMPMTILSLQKSNKSTGTQNIFRVGSTSVYLHRYEAATIRDYANGGSFDASTSVVPTNRLLTEAYYTTTSLLQYINGVAGSTDISGAGTTVGGAIAIGYTPGFQNGLKVIFKRL